MRTKTLRFLGMLLSFALLLAFLAIPAGAAGGSMAETFEDAFKTYKGEWAGGGLSPIKMRLKEDTLTFDYSPVFYFDPSFSLTEVEKAAIVDDCVAGFKRWAGVYEIDGRELTVVVDVHAGTTTSLLVASVRVISGRYGASVPGCLLWRPCSPFLGIYLRTGNPQYMDFEDMAMHEFGHVLGLFDAYGYGVHGYSILGMDFGWLAEWLLPEAPPDRAPQDAVMRSSWMQVIYPTDIEMLLYAWKNNRLQLYTKSALTWLGAEVSPAFS